MLLLIVAVAVTMKIRAARYANSPRLQRDQAMKHLLGLRVTEIDKALSAQDTRGFLASCRKTIQLRAIGTEVKERPVKISCKIRKNGGENRRGCYGGEGFIYKWQIKEGKR